MCAHRCAFTVGDEFAGFERRAFTLLGNVGCPRGIDGPRVKQVQVAHLGDHVLHIGQTSHSVFGSEARNVISRFHGLRYGRF
jgi:hypothetical protein